MGAVHDVATGTPIEVNADGSINVAVLGTLTLAAAVDVSDRVGRLLGHVTVDNASLAVTGPLTDTQLRATAVPISGTVTASGPLTDTQLRAAAVPTKETRPSAGTPSAFVAAVTNATIFAANAARLGATIDNNNATANLYVKLGATATTVAGGFAVKIAAGGYYEVPYGYTGIIDGIWDSASGNAASATELT